MEQEPKIEYLSFAKEIKGMYEKDQEMRKRAMANNGIIENEEDSKLDSIHTQRMKEIVKQMGWPTISKVGETVSDMAWLLVQHADHDIEFQKQCLELMKQTSNDVSKVNIAYLEDRVKVNSGRPQIYGTQFYEHDGIYEPRPIEELDKVDKRRKEVGLESLKEYARMLKEKYKK